MLSPVYDGLLYGVRQGPNNNGELRYGSFKGKSWSEDKVIKIGDKKYGTSASPALEVFDNRLFGVRQGRNHSGEVWYKFPRR